MSTLARLRLYWTLAAAASPVLLMLLLLGFLVVLVEEDEQLQAQAAAGGCRTSQPGLPVDVGGLPASPVAGYAGEQLRNAALIMNAGAALGLSVHGQTVGVMTAMGESSLEVIDHGDAAGPDSRGLFQQRANGAWGSYSDRMDPTVSATSFFTALMAVPGWETLPPTLAAHRTQRNADPNHYARYWGPAQQVVAALSGAAVAPAPAGSSAAQQVAAQVPCGQVAPAPVGAGGWTRPAVGRLTSPFGNREDPTGSGTQMHRGQDIGAPCGTPVVAAGAGVVVRAGRSSGYGNLIAVDHGGGAVTRYAHSYDQDVLVVVGQQVTAGQQIARVGSFGDSTGCHLHLEVQLDGELVDPIPFLTARGVSFT